MKKVTIHYFSGTGNTAHAVKLIAQQLKASSLETVAKNASDNAGYDAGYEVTILQVKKGVLPPKKEMVEQNSGNKHHSKPPDYHIFAFPVLSWAPPVIMKRYLRKMPKSKGAKVAILAINGSIFHDGKLVKGYTGQALEQAENILLNKNYDVFLTANASYPDNWTQATNPCSIEDTAAIFPLGDAEVMGFTENFIEEESELYRCGWFNKIWSHAIAGMFGLIGRRALGKFYIADENCTGCSICAKQCPVKTIRMDRHKPQSRPYWGINCEDCNRCINTCPERAIQVSVPIMILQLVINTGLIVWAIGAILNYTPLWLNTDNLLINANFLLISAEIILITIATLIVHWISFVPLDAFFRLLLRIPGARKFLSYSYTKNFRRYKAPE